MFRLDSERERKKGIGTNELRRSRHKRGEEMSSETHSHLMTLAPAEIKDIFGCVGWQQQQHSRSQRKDGTANKRNRKENQNIVNESHVVVVEQQQQQQQQLENYGKQPTLRCGFSFSTRPKFDSILFYFFFQFLIWVKYSLTKQHGKGSRQHLV